MALTASNLINEVRDLTFVGSEKCPNATILRALARAEREIIEAAISLGDAVEVFAAEATFDANDIAASFSGGTPLAVPSHYAILDAFAELGDDARRVVFILPARMRFETPQYELAGFLDGNELRLRTFDFDDEGSEWDDVTTLRVRYIPVPTAPAALASNLTVPDFCQTFLVLRAACFVKQFVNGGRTDPDLEVKAKEAKTALLDVLFNHDASVTWSTRVV
jgi:hypothetical protein